MPSLLPRLRRFLATAALAAGTLLVMPTPGAQAQVFVGAGFGYPFYPLYQPRVVFAPPAFYYPPRVVFAPPPAYVAAPVGRCLAGAYVCPLDRPGPIGATCSCPTNTGRARGQIG